MTQKYRIESWTVMGEEMKKYIVGPMPAIQFLNDFFPTSHIPGYNPAALSFSAGCYRDTVNAQWEVQAYEPFITTSRQYAQQLKFVNSSAVVDSNPLSTLPFHIKPDISVYPANLAATDENDEIKTNSSLAEIFIEFKWESGNDPFCELDSKHLSLLHDVKAAHDTLGQITSYASAQLGSQFRTHIFSVFIVKGIARLLRWDRSGMIVTDAFKYNECDTLAQFFFRYSMAPPAMRGKDQSVSDPLPTEEVAARNALGLDPNTALVKLSIPDADGVRFFVTHAPIATLYTPPGRATRGFTAYDILRKTVVFLKDTWRIDLQDLQPEGQVYRTLNDADVPNVPHCVASGDISTEGPVDYNFTKTHAYVDEPWSCRLPTHGEFTPHRHYRLALDLVGRVLVDYKSSYEMVSAVRDALIAHKGAFCEGILHRDISPGNIIIDSNGKGWLVDWDMSKPTALSAQIPRRTTRTGTWQFLSANLMNPGNAPHGFLDDLESSLYVLLWTTLMYSDVPDKDHVDLFLKCVLDPHPRNDKGGFVKEDFLLGQTFLEKVKFPERRRLHKLISGLAQLFRFRYRQDVPTEDQRKYFNDLKKALTLAGPTPPPYLQRAYNLDPCKVYDDAMSNLNDHEGTIKLFTDAVRDRLEWPINDSSVKQVFGDKLPTGPVLKSDWRSTRVWQ